MYFERKFNNTKIPFEKGDVIYLGSDGFTDQLGGTLGKRFMKRRFLELLSNIHNQNMNDQKKKLEEAINKWQGEHEQTDDIMIIGIRF